MIASLDRFSRRLDLPTGVSGIVLAVVVLAGALLRLATLDLQSFSHDEAVTVLHVLHPGLFDTLEAVADRERSGPLYYALAWLWSQVALTGEIGLRSLPAMFGTLTIPVAYLLASEVATRRAGVIAAALVAFNPFLFWYSQEARSYSLFVLLAALSLLFLARALRRPSTSRREVAFWAAASAGALASHYFALFVVIPEALWLLYRLRNRSALIAVAATAIAGAALLPLALEQGAQRSGLFADTTLTNRLLESAAKFSAGNELSLFPELAGVHTVSAVVSGLAAVLWIPAVLLSLRRNGPDRLLPAGIGLLALVLPSALAVAGQDLVNPRNLIGAVVPLLVAAGVGLGGDTRGILGSATAGLLSLLFLVNIGLILSSPTLQRQDYRGVEDALGEPRGPRLIVAPQLGVPQLSLHLEARRETTAGLPTVRGAPALRASEIAVVAPAGGEPPPPPPDQLAQDPRFELASSRTLPEFEVSVYRADEPLAISLRALSDSRLAGGNPAILSDGGDPSD